MLVPPYRAPRVAAAGCVVPSGSWRRRLVSAVILLAAAAANTAVLLDFEFIKDSSVVGDFYGGQLVGGGTDYGIVFGDGAVGAVDADEGGSFGFAHEPSPSTVLFLTGDERQAFLTVSGGFTGLSFQYTSENDVNVTVYAGPNRTGTVLGSITLPAVGYCRTDCGDPTGDYGVWRNVTVPFSGGGGVARSAGFSTGPGNQFLFVDDMLIELAPPTNPPTKAPTTTKVPTQAPTKRPTRYPTTSPLTACRKGMMMGNTKRCRKKTPKG
jgi:hypothetical protein